MTRKAENLVRSYGIDIKLKSYANMTPVTTALISALEDLQNIEGPGSQIYETIWYELLACPNRHFVQLLEEREAMNSHGDVL